MEKNVRTSISEIGDDIIYIQKFPWEIDFSAPWWEYMKRPDPKVSEYRELSRRSLLADKVCLTAYAQRTVKQGNNAADNTNLNLVSYEFYDIKPFDFEQGRYFTLPESEAGHNCCILGFDIASKLFDNQNPIGKNIDLMGVWPSDPSGKNYSQHFWHSAEFRGDNAMMQGYWSELLGSDAFNLK